MPPPLFIDPAHQAAFEEDGYVQLPLLTPEDIQGLKALFVEYHPEAPKGFDSTSYRSDYATKKEASDRAVAIIGKRFEGILQNYRIFGSSFLSKPKGPHGAMPMHQDWTIVDEDRFVAVNIWTPLVDCTQKNGTLEVLKGSHRYLKVTRMPTQKFVLDGKQEALKPMFTPLPTKAGEAVILNQALVHYSKPSQVEEVRSAITTGVKSAEAPMQFYYFDESQPDQLEKFAMEEDFLLQFEQFHTDIFQRPKMGESQGHVPFKAPQFTWEGVLSEIKAAHGGVLPSPPVPPAPQKKSFFQKIVGIFSK